VTDTGERDKNTTPIHGDTKYHGCLPGNFDIERQTFSKLGEDGPARMEGAIYLKEKPRNVRTGAGTEIAIL